MQVYHGQPKNMLARMYLTYSNKNKQKNNIYILFQIFFFLCDNTSNFQVTVLITTLTYKLYFFPEFLWCHISTGDLAMQHFPKHDYTSFINGEMKNT